MKREIKNMGFKVFVDTDVVIDFLIDRQPHATASSKVFEICNQGIIEVLASSLCINNVHYIIKKVIGDRKAREIIEELLEFITVLDVSIDHIREALNSDFKDFEDAIQHSVAMGEKDTRSILTRNTKDYKKSKIAVFAPDTFIRMMERDEK